MKVAICVFGQLRDEHLTLPKLGAIAQKLDAEVFVATWSRRGTKLTGATYTSQLVRIFGEEIAFATPRSVQHHFSEMLPEFFVRAASAGSVVGEKDLDQYFTKYEIKISEDRTPKFETKFNDNNSLRMLDRLHAANEMRRRREQAIGAEFDIVICCRPDMLPPDAQVIRELAIADNGLYVVQGGKREGHLADGLLIGSAKSINVCASLYEKAKASTKETWLGIHRELSDIVDDAGVTTEEIVPGSGFTEDRASKQPGHRAILLDVVSHKPAEEEATSNGTRWRTLGAIFAAAGECSEGRPLDAVHRLEDLRDEDWTLEAIEAGFSVLTDTLAVVDKEAAQAALLARIFTGLALDGPNIANKSEFSNNINRFKKVGAKDVECPEPTAGAIGSALGRVTNSSLPQRLWKRALEARSGSRTTECFALLADMLGRSAEYIAMRFWRALAAGEISESRRWADDLLERFPNDWRGQDHLGHFFTRVGNHSGALRCAEAAAEMAPQHWGLVARVAVAREAVGDIQGAMIAIDRAMALGGHSAGIVTSTRRRLEEKLMQQA